MEINLLKAQFVFCSLQKYTKVKLNNFNVNVNLKFVTFFLFFGMLWQFECLRFTSVVFHYINQNSDFYNLQCNLFLAHSPLILYCNIGVIAVLSLFMSFNSCDNDAVAAAVVVAESIIWRNKEMVIIKYIVFPSARSFRRTTHIKIIDT